MGSRVLHTLVTGIAVSGLVFSWPARSTGDRELVQYLSSECVTCHQLSGKFQGIPPIVGWPETSFVQIMNEYRSKKRENPVMQTIDGKLSQEEIAALAAYFGSLQPQSQ